MMRLGALLCWLLVACTPAQRAYTPTAAPAGVVVSGSAIASDVGAQVLTAGGNATDAAVATAFALAVVEPTMSGIGGRSQVLIRTARGDVVGLDGTTQVPAAYPGRSETGQDTYGYGTIGIPGTIAVLAAALERQGTWSLARALAPAIRIAEDGFVLPPAEAARIAAEAERLREFEGSRGHFLKPDGSTYAAGERFRQRDLARTLRAVAEGGPEAFYEGSIAARIDADMRTNGGWLRAEDLAGYAPEDGIVVRGSYRGRELIGTYLPASGATTIQALQILEHFDLPELAGRAEWIDVVAQALSLAFEDREAEHGPPHDGAARITSKARAAELAARIKKGEIPHPQAAGRSFGPLQAWESPHTTHVSVVDRTGMAVALTQSVGPTLGSRVAAPGLGFIYAATMGYLGDLRPGERPWSSQSPMLVLEGGKPRYVIGGAGARRIISAIVQTLSRAIDEEMSLEHALAAPRFHVSADTIHLERRIGAGWSDRVQERLRVIGYDVRSYDDPEYFARLNAIEVHPRSGSLIGIPDPRWPGRASRAR